MSLIDRMRRKKLDALYKLRRAVVKVATLESIVVRMERALNPTVTEEDIADWAERYNICVHEAEADIRNLIARCLELPPEDLDREKTKYVQLKARLDDLLLEYGVQNAIVYELFGPNDFQRN